MMLLAMGWTNVRIAAALAITPPTLRKNYFRELKVREEALHRMKAAHMEMLWEQAKAGNVSAMKEIGRLIAQRSEEHTSELQSLMRKSYAVYCLKKKNNSDKQKNTRKSTYHTENLTSSTWKT